MSLFASIFFGFHDSGISFSDHKEILLHIDAERVLRKKHMRASVREMESLLAVGLNHLGKTVDDIETLFIGKWGCEKTDSVYFLGRKFNPKWTNHHANHVGYGKMLNWEDAVAVCADGGSELGCSATYLYDGNRYEVLEDLDATILTGRYYGSLTQIVIGDDFESAHVHWPGKTMGLSAFGKDEPAIRRKLGRYSSEMNELHIDGVSELASLIGVPGPPTPNSWKHWNLAKTGQAIWEDAWLEKLAQYRSMSRNLIFSGGCALNVCLNYKIRQSGMFERIFVPPCPGDDGQSLGALVHHLNVDCNFPFMGMGFGQAHTCPDEVVDDLLAGNIVFWHNGRAEVGPRALGHRSILGLPNSVKQRRRISETIKGREWYRPVAAIVPEEEASNWFQTIGPSPYMLEAIPVKEKTWERAPAIVHADGTCRVQTLSKSVDPILHQLLSKIGQANGVPILMNTSMNGPGEPICNTPQEAISTFKRSSADSLYIAGNFTKV